MRKAADNGTRKRIRYRRLICCATAAALAGAAPVVGTGLPNAAFAETYTATSAEVSEGFSTAIEEARARSEAAAENYKAARTAYIGEGARAYVLDERVALLEGLVPEQEERRDEAARQLYKLQQDKYNMIEMLLASESLDDFIAQTEYLDRITEANVAEINETNAFINAVGNARTSVEETRAQAQASLEYAQAESEAADRALESVYEAREERARSGIRRAQEEAAGGSVASSSDSADDGSSASSSAARVELSSDVSALDDGADWHMTEEEFVAEWAPRLNTYLAGSALAGEGEHFAKSAWKYCIDPRWSAAISHIESGKGAVCIQPHNAWGWAAYDGAPAENAATWPTWEDAIDAHSKGLANIYGYTLTMSGARMYCPPNWEAWYNTTLNEMAKI